MNKEDIFTAPSEKHTPVDMDDLTVNEPVAEGLTKGELRRVINEEVLRAFVRSTLQGR